MCSTSTVFAGSGNFVSKTERILNKMTSELNYLIEVLKSFAHFQSNFLGNVAVNTLAFTANRRD